MELAPDVYCLCGTGIVTLHGLRVAFTASREKALEAEEGAPVASACSLTEAVVEMRARAGEVDTFAGCDLLLTHE